MDEDLERAYVLISDVLNSLTQRRRGQTLGYLRIEEIPNWLREAARLVEEHERRETQAQEATTTE